MKVNIMTIEDSTSLRELINFTLSKENYNVIEAEDGKDALAKLNGDKIDLFLTDLNMPKMNGIELTQALRSKREYRFTPIIFLTTETKSMMKQVMLERSRIFTIPSTMNLSCPTRICWRPCRISFPPLMNLLPTHLVCQPITFQKKRVIM